MGTKLYSINTFLKEAKEIAFDGIFKLLPINFSWMDAKGHILGCNDQVLKVQEIDSFADIVGKHTSEVCNSNAWENTQKVVKSGKPLVLDEEHHHSDGRTTYFLSVKSPIKSPNEKVIGVVNIAVDITERKLLEIELEKTKESAELANKIKTEFLANMRHDLRTPLCGLSNILEYLEKDELDETKRSYLEEARNCTASILTQLNDILDHVRVESGELDILEKKFSLPEVLENIYKSLFRQASDKNLEFKITCDVNIPKNVIGDPLRTERILMNVLSNALKFTHKGYVKLTLDWIHLADEKGIAQFIIEDSGIGIPEDKLEHIFERFIRLTDASTALYPGTGLGLNIVKRFLSDIDGRYDVTSELGKGSTFNICIPYKVIETNREASKMNRILLVEDHPVICTMSKLILEDMEELNCKVDVATSGHTALELIDKNTYDLVLLDIGLPDIDGHIVAKCIRNHENHNISKVPILAITAHAEDEEAQRCVDAGIQKIIIKPLTTEIAKTFLQYLS